MLTPEELRRYSRHLLIPDLGIEGQQKLKAARVLVIGCGGLGSPILLYLAAAGVGTIGVVDGDRVDDSNLQRQIMYGSESVGKPKVEETHTPCGAAGTCRTSARAPDAGSRRDASWPSCRW